MEVHLKRDCGCAGLQITSRCPRYLPQGLGPLLSALFFLKGGSPKLPAGLVAARLVWFLLDRSIRVYWQGVDVREQNRAGGSTTRLLYVKGVSVDAMIPIHDCGSTGLQYLIDFFRSTSSTMLTRKSSGV